MVSSFYCPGMGFKENVKTLSVCAYRILHELVLKLPLQSLQSMSLEGDLAHLKVDTCISASHLGSYLDTPEFCSFFFFFKYVIQEEQ